MAKKASKVSVNDMDKIISEANISPSTWSCDTADGIITIEISPNIPYEKRAQLVVDIADTVFVEGEYAPSAFRFACGYCKLKYFTNMTIPKDYEKVWSLLCSTNIEEAINDVIDTSIEDEAKDLIEFRKAVYLRETKFETFMGSLTNLATKAEQLLTNAENNGFANLDIKKLVDSISNFSNKDENKIVDFLVKYHDSQKQE